MVGAQLTILDSGKVNVYEDVPAYQVDNIKKYLHSNGNSSTISDEYRQGTAQVIINTDQTTANINTFNSVGDGQFGCSRSLFPSRHRITQVEKKQPRQQLVTRLPQAEFPLARKATPAARFLKKRKDRLDAKLIKKSSMAAKVYPASPACKKIDYQVLEMVGSRRLPAPLSEMHPLVVQELRYCFRNMNPTPTCPRSPCPNPANTAFRSFNNPSKTLLLQPVFACRSCKHRFTLNGRLRKVPIHPYRPRRDARNQQAAPDHSSPPFFSSSPGTEQQLQAAGQITTYNPEYGLLQQQQGAEQDRILNNHKEMEPYLLLQDEAFYNTDLTQVTNNSSCAAAGREYTATAVDMEAVLAADKDWRMEDLDRLTTDDWWDGLYD